MFRLGFCNIQNNKGCGKCYEITLTIVIVTIICKVIDHSIARSILNANFIKKAACIKLLGYYFITALVLYPLQELTSISKTEMIS